MANWKLPRLGKRIVIVASVMVCILIATGSWFFMRSNKPLSTHHTCSDYSAAVYDPASPKNLKEFVEETPGIVVAKVLNPEAFNNPVDSESAEPRVRVTDVIKGSSVLKVGDDLLLCPNVALNPSDHTWQTVVLFLEGKNNGHWVPNRGYIGVIPQNKDGRFATEMLKESPAEFTANDLRSLAK